MADICLEWRECSSNAMQCMLVAGGCLALHCYFNFNQFHMKGLCVHCTRCQVNFVMLPFIRRTFVRKYKVTCMCQRQIRLHDGGSAQMHQLKSSFYVFLPASCFPPFARFCFVWPRITWSCAIKYISTWAISYDCTIARGTRWAVCALCHCANITKILAKQKKKTRIYDERAHSASPSAIHLFGGSAKFCACGHSAIFRSASFANDTLCYSLGIGNDMRRSHALCLAHPLSRSHIVRCASFYIYAIVIVLCLRHFRIVIGSLQLLGNICLHTAVVPIR